MGKDPFADVLEDDGTRVEYHPHHPFSNWIGRHASVPCVTFVPYSRTGICNVVKWAKRNGKKVRACGFRHTSSNLYPDSGDHVLISMISLRDAEVLPRREIPINVASDLVGIQVLEEHNETALVRIGASTTNEQFRQWAVGTLRLGKSWTVPSDVNVEITFGGSLATLSHGPGLRHQTLSDLVRAVEFVNCRGELQTVSDPDELKAVAGCFGLLGVVTALTLELDAMTYAKFDPTAEPLAVAIPPPDDPSLLGLPHQVYHELFDGVSDIQLASSRARFWTQCENHYHAEWFWFVFTDKCFVNVWNNDGDPATATPEFPSPCETQLQEVLGHLVETFSHVDTPNRVETVCIGELGLRSAPHGVSHVSTPLINALHFRRGIRNGVKSMEVILPIPRHRDGTPDWTLCQRAWWDGIKAIQDYKLKGRYPVRTALEMRILGDSLMLLAPERGNRTHRAGSCSIEVVTFENTPDDEWKEFTQYLFEVWSRYTDSDGAGLEARPHWAKQWDHLTVSGVAYATHFATAHAPEVADFRARVAKVCEAGGYSPTDLTMFSTQTLECLGLVGPLIG